MKLLSICLLAICISSCGPKICSFTADRRIVTSRDSIHLDWKVRGKASLSIYEKKIRIFMGDSVTVYEFFLISTMGKRSSNPRPLQVMVVPSDFRDFLVLPVTARRGDTLIASGSKDSAYLDFKVWSLASISGRGMMVEHFGSQAVLSDSGVLVKTLQGLDYAGPWEIRSMVTPEEKENPRLIPDQFVIAVFIQPKNR